MNLRFHNIHRFSNAAFRKPKDSMTQALFLLAVVSLPWSVFVFEAACLLLLAIALVPSKSENFPRSSSIHFLIALYIVFVILSIIFSISLSSSLGEFRKLWHVLLFFVGGVSAFSKQRIELSFRLLCISSAFAAITIFPLAFAKSFITPHNATTLDYLFVAATMASAIFFLTQKRNSWKLFWAVVMILNLAGVLLLHLRLPIVLAGAGILTLSLLFYKRQRSGYLAIVSAILFFFLLPGVTTSRIQLTLSGYSESRFVIWDSAVKLLPHTPLFGYGPQTFERLFPDKARVLLDDRRAASWQSDIFSAVLDSGFQTLSVLLLILVLLFRKIASHHILMEGDSAVPQSGTFFIVSVGIMLVAALANNVFDDPRLGGFFWLMSGIFYDYGSVVAS